MDNGSQRFSKTKVTTSDGSMTLYSEEFGESYHSTRDGALNESLQKHIAPAFGFKAHQESLTILDICFGLGYNTFATLMTIKKNYPTTKVHIISPEFDQGLIESLPTFEYPSRFEPFGDIIKALAQNKTYSNEWCTIEILIGDARVSLPRLNTKFDIIYQDPFSPKKNPLLWTREYFALIASLMKPDGVLTTYSIASAVRMGLHESGLKLFRHKGEGIRESMVASREALMGLEPIDMELKMVRNPNAKSLRDADYTSIQEEGK